MNKVIAMLEYQFKISEFSVDVNVLKEPLWVYGDNTAIAEALINVISNSLKYSAESRVIEISAYSENSNGILKIKDYGIGISEENLKNIYEPFYRGSNKEMKQTGGAGLGLAIVRHIMNAHKGEVRVLSKLDKGTTVYMSFPLETRNAKNINN